jgi:hypothetical protein
MSFINDHIFNYIIYYYNNNELGYNAMRSTGGSYVIDRFSIFKVQIIDLTVQNDFHIKI